MSLKDIRKTKQAEIEARMRAGEKIMGGIAVTPGARSGVNTDGRDEHGPHPMAAIYRRSNKAHQLQYAISEAAMRWYEADAALERGFPGATCSGPERHYMQERLSALIDLKAACVAYDRWRKQERG